jgi:anti-sigma-K factor RskA
MRDEHIIGWLEDAPLGSLGAHEGELIRAHIGHCAECRRAYEAARAAASLLRERSAAAVEPSPFFKTRVMAAVREQRTTARTSAFAGLWRTAGWLVSSMAALVLVLAAATFADYGAQVPTGSAGAVAGAENYAAELALFAPEGESEQMTYDQVLTSVYEPTDAEENYGRDQ